MKSWNKKMMTLACATCLTVGMGAVACADTVDLGYGQYANTSAGVKAVAVMKVPTNANHRSAEQNKFIVEANKNGRDITNEIMKKEYSVSVPMLKGELINGFSVYQLQGKDALGYHTAYIASLDYSGDMINQSLEIERQLLATGSEKDKEKLKNGISHVVNAYSKDNAEGAIKNLKGQSYAGKVLDTKLVPINQELQSVINKSISEAISQDPKMTAEEKTKVIQLVKKFTAPIRVGATYVSYEPVSTKYGMAAKGSIRGNFQYDGFTWPGAVIGYAIPQQEGVITQFLITEDTSYDFWNRELDAMHQTKAYKGGK